MRTVPEKYERIWLVFLALSLFAILLCGAALAQDEEEGDDNDGVAIDLQDDVEMGAEEAVEESIVAEEEVVALDVAYLDDADSSDGELTLLLKLDTSGEESPFYGRYHNPFEDDSFYLDNFAFRGADGNTWFNFGISDA